VYLIIGFAGMGSKSEGAPQSAGVSAEKNDSADIELGKTFSFGDIKFDINSKWKKTETNGIVVFNINDTYKLYATKTDYDKSLISIDDALNAYLINDETYTTEYTTDEREVDGNKVVLFSQYKKGSSGKDEYSRHFVTVCGDYSYNVYISAPETEYNESRCIAFMNEILYTLQMPRMETPEETTEEETTETPTEKATEARTTEAVIPINVVSYTAQVDAGANASLTISAAPNTEYDIDVQYSSGESNAAGLENKFTDGNGNATWEWEVGTNTKPGTYSIIISGGNNTITTEFTVK
jgi:hypothetical protein